MFGTILILVIIYGCDSAIDPDFKKGIKRINKINDKFDATMRTPPDSKEGVDELLIQLIGFSAANKGMPQSLEYLLDFRIINLEAEKLHVEGWQWGRGSTTDYGFGCRKGSARVLNSSKIRNSSAQKGFESLSSLQLLVDEFPNEAKSVNLTQKDVLFFNAAYYQIERKARRDAAIIRNACKEQIKELNITI